MLLATAALWAGPGRKRRHRRGVSRVTQQSAARHDLPHAAEERFAADSQARPAHAAGVFCRNAQHHAGIRRCLYDLSEPARAGRLENLRRAQRQLDGRHGQHGRNPGCSRSTRFEHGLHAVDRLYRLRHLGHPAAGAGSVRETFQPLVEGRHVGDRQRRRPPRSRSSRPTRTLYRAPTFCSCWACRCWSRPLCRRSRPGCRRAHS